MKNFLKLFVTLAGALLGIYGVIMGLWWLISLLESRVPIGLEIPVLLIAIAGVIAGIMSIVEKIVD